MIIEVRKFGEILVSRPAGREAALIISEMVPSSETESIELDFAGVQVVGPSWLDEVLSSLRQRFGERVIVLPTGNATVAASLRAIDGLAGPAASPR